MFSFIEFFLRCIASTSTQLSCDAESMLTVPFLFHFFASFQILAVGAEPVLSRFTINGTVLSQIKCAPQSAFSVSIHSSGVCTYLPADPHLNFWLCNISQWMQPLLFRWHLLLDMEGWWMWSQNSGVICAHLVVEAWISRVATLSVFDDATSKICAMWSLYFCTTIAPNIARMQLSRSVQCYLCFFSYYFASFFLSMLYLTNAFFLLRRYYCAFFHSMLYLTMLYWPWWFLDGE